MIEKIDHLYQYFSSASDDDWQSLLGARQNLLAATQLTINRSVYQQISQFIEIYEQIALAKLKKCTDKQPQQNISNSILPGIFYSFDFHLDNQLAKLIEVNSNAGGIFINSVLANAWQQILAANTQQKENIYNFANQQQIVAVFQQEWLIYKPEQKLQVIAIVDDQPKEQYLYPEFLLCKHWLEQANYTCIIVSPEQLNWNATSKRLSYDGLNIDFVYNRLTDFSLNQQKYANILAAYRASAIVLSPNPLDYQVMADKSILSELSQRIMQNDNSLSIKEREILENTLAYTQKLASEQLRQQPQLAEELWQQRKKWFFKPQSGYGGQAVYRGDKMTKKVFNEILLRDDYLLQEYAAPGVHQYLYAGEMFSLKYDLRCYRSHGQTLGLCARLYQGQTTNFRSRAGGFASVIVA